MNELHVSNVVNSVELRPHLERKHPHRWRGQYRAKLEQFIIAAFESTSSAETVSQYLECRHVTVSDVWKKHFGTAAVEEREHRIRSINRGGTGEHEYGEGWLIDPDGYRKVKTPYGWKFEHQWVWFQHTGEWVTLPNIIHHKDHNKLNNVFDNLEVMTNSEHRRLHQLERVTTIPRGSNGQFISSGCL